MASRAQAASAAHRPEDKASPPREAGEVACLTAADMATRIGQWDTLAGEASEPNPFMESWHLLPSLGALDPRGRARIVTYSQGGTLRGILPVVRSRRYYGHVLPHLATWAHANSFLGTPLIARGHEVQFWHAVLRWADANAGAALFLHLPELGLDGPVHAALEAVADVQGREWGLVERHERAVLESRCSADDYRARTFSPTKRKDLRRRLRRLSELGEVRWDWQQGPDGIEGWIEEFLALEGSGWKGKRGSALRATQANAAMFRQSLSGAAARGRLMRLALRIDGRPIAMLATFVTPPGAFGYKTAFDEDFARHAPGIQLEHEFLSALDMQAFAWCDSCAAPDHPVMNSIWSERRAIGKASIAIGGGLRRALFSQLLRMESGSKSPAGDLS